MQHFGTNTRPLYSDKQIAKMVEALLSKGFEPLGDFMWSYKSKNNEKFISVRIDLAGYIIVNFNNRLTKSMTPQQVIDGTNYIKGKQNHPILYLP